MSYRLINKSRLDDATVERLVAFAWERVPGGISRITAIKIHDGKGASGRAADRRTHRFPKWAGRATYAVTASVPPDDHHSLGRARVCWHSAKARELADAYGLDYVYRWVEREQAAGYTHIGRWPIYVQHDPVEAVLHTVAHELSHVLGFDRGRKGNSELLCEGHALATLEAWQAGVAA